MVESAKALEIRAYADPAAEREEITAKALDEPAVAGQHDCSKGYGCREGRRPRGAARQEL